MDSENSALESEWTPLVSLNISGSGIAIVDPMSWNSVHITLKRGTYQVDTRTVIYEERGGDSRISRVRVSSTKGGIVVGQIAEIGVDAATIGILDARALAPQMARQVESREQELSDAWQGDEPTGTVNWGDDDDAVMAFVRTGFGDGNYAIKEILKADVRVGFEIEFIKPKKPYPF